MQTLNKYLSEALIKKDTKLLNNIYKLVDDIFTHLLVLRPNLTSEVEEKAKEIIKKWVEDNNINEVEYWISPGWKDKIRTKKPIRNIKLRDYNCCDYPAYRYKGKDEAIWNNLGRSKGSLLTTPKYIEYYGNEYIFCFKKS